MALGPSRGRRRTLLLAVYLILLLSSHLVRAVRPAPRLSPTTSRIELPSVTATGRGQRTIRFAYQDHSADLPRAPTLVLLHGSPGGKDDFRSVVTALRGRYRIIVPDLPGFGESTRRLPVYSIRSHAEYVRELLERLNVDRCHVVGFSMGGGVALHLSELAPERVASVVLLSAIGVQELELLGNYQLNHLVHGAQLAALWMLHETLPHFGMLDRFPIDLPYARNFYDSDQRPLRGILGRFEPPMLIVHGADDFLVPAAAAREHHRLVPQSELSMLDASHFMVFLRPGLIAAQLERWVERVTRGEAAARIGATTERLRAAARPFDPATAPPVAGFGLLVMMGLIAIATLVSEDLTCIAVGLMAGQGRIDFLPAVAACFVGIVVGDMLLYLAGRLVGRPALSRIPLRWWLSDDRVAAASDWFRRRGAIVILASRFLPGARLPTYFAAGALRTGFWAFAAYFCLAVALWTPILVGAAMLLGSRAADAFAALQQGSFVALVLAALTLLVLLKLIIPLCSYRGRRLLVGAWRRLAHWEFWPPWLFYPPVLLYLAWLGARHRRPLAFTCANPAIEAGGFVSESKSAILDDLRGSPDHVACHTLIPAGSATDERTARVRSFVEERGLDYPIVLKPDTGQRGSGVAIVADEAAVAGYLKRADYDVVAQEYAPGQELGLFYYRYPSQPRGQLLSITDKRIPELIGDGKRTLERLILDDSRAVAMARVYCARFAGRLQQVLPEGERLPLAELGTHCRGAVFLDGRHYGSEALERRIDRISRAYDGFFFGRYDVRAVDLEALAAGGPFKIIELNGVTSEATHIYDPSIGLFEAYRVLFEQWRIAFEIGRQNIERGARPTRLRDLLQLIRRYRESSRSHEVAATTGRPGEVAHVEGGSS